MAVFNGERSRLSRLFDGISGAADRGQPLEALRLADSARRLAPDNPTARLIYARALLGNGEARAAVESLRGREDPQSLVVVADASRRADSPEEASHVCRRLLANYAVDSIPELSATANEVCRAGIEAPGWVGIDSELRLVGELTEDAAAIIEWGDSSIGRITGNAEPPLKFAVDIPPHSVGPIRVRVGDRDLLGSPLRWPIEFGAIGWVLLEERQLTGEVHLNWDPKSAVTVIVAPGRGEARFRVEAAPGESSGRPFSWRLDDRHLELPELDVAVLLPGGGLAPLLGSPLKLSQLAPRPIAQLSSRLAKTVRRRTSSLVNIVVPVYSGLTETMTCLDSVLATTSPRTALVTVVDDATPDPELRRALETLNLSGRITLIRNSTNLGYPGAVNRGMRLRRGCDVVLLNADTEVFPGWLERLRSAAYSADGIGTVTPLGEEATIVSYAGRDRRPWTSAEAARIDGIALKVNADRLIDIPVGVGFCLYVRRDCLDDIGEFDEHSFAKGYGEENDFCLRARSGGWRHVTATGVFVRHVGGRSFGAAKSVLLRRNQRLINHRHRGYDALVDAFIRQDPLRVAKRAIDVQMLMDAAVKPVLLVSLELDGGVKRHVDERRARLAAEGHTVLVLRADSKSAQDSARDSARDSVQESVTDSAKALAQDRCSVRLEALNFTHLVYDLPADIAELRTLLVDLDLSGIEIHHFLGLGAAVLDLLVGLGVPYRVIVHDYSWVCPRITLLNGEGIYCGEPAVAVCERCVTRHGSALGEAIPVAALRARSARVLGGAQRVLVPTHDVRTRLARYFPDVRVDVEPWEGPVETVQPQRVSRRRREGRVRVLLLGAIDTKKGYRILLECARDAARRDLPLEFTLVGFSGDDAPLLETGRVFITGPYQDIEVAALLDREGCDLALFPTLGPETWCYALTHVLAQGLPIVAFDLGAVAERLRGAATGVLLPLDTSPAALNDALLGVAAGRTYDDGVAAELTYDDGAAAWDAADEHHHHRVAADRAYSNGVPADLTCDDGVAADLTYHDGVAADLAGSDRVAADVTYNDRVATEFESSDDVGILEHAMDSANHGHTQDTTSASSELSATVELLNLPVGLYSFTVQRVDGAAVGGAAGDLKLPALNVAPAPARSQGAVEFQSGPATVDRWLTGPGDVVTAKITGGDAVLLLTSIRTGNSGVLSINVTRLDAPAPALPDAAVLPADLRIVTLVHLPYLGDLTFAEGWAGKPADNLWIEGFSILVEDSSSPELIQYCGVSEDGEVTAWMTGGEFCGERGTGIPLVAFALRVAPDAAPHYTCRYRGRFLSGTVIGPFDDGRFCRSEAPGDPLVAMELEIKPTGAALHR